MINFQDAYNSLFGGNSTPVKQVVNPAGKTPLKIAPPPQSPSLMGGIGNAVGSAISGVGNYIKQDFLRAPQVQAITNGAQVANAIGTKISPDFKTTPTSKLLQGDIVGSVKAIPGAFQKANEPFKQQRLATMQAYKSGKPMTKEEWTKVNQPIMGAVIGSLTGPAKIAEEVVAKQAAMKWAENSKTVEDFTKMLGGAKPEVRVAVENILKDSKNSINTVEDFYNFAKSGGKDVMANIPLGKTNIPLDQTVPVKPLVGEAKIPQNKQLKAELPVQAGGQKVPLSTPINPAENLSSGGSIPPESDPVKNFLEVLKNAKAVRTTQDIGYSAARSQKFNQFSTVLKSGGGEKGAREALSKMGGELPKIKFEPLQVSQEVKDSLFNSIAGATHLQPGEQASAIGGLDNLIKGITPPQTQIKALESVFGKDIGTAINNKLSLGQKVGKNLLEIGNLPRALQASTDLSAPFRQGIVLAPSHPKEFGKAFKNMLGYAFSEKKFMDGGKHIIDHPNYARAKDSGLAFTVPDGALNQKEEAFMSNLAERIGLRLPVGFGKKVNVLPVGAIVRASNRAYTGFLNDLRFGTFNSILKGAEKMGKGDDVKFLHDLAGFVNNATGRGNLKSIPGIGSKLEDSAPLLNAAFFSPRLIASRVNLMNPYYYAKLEPTVRKEAMKSMTAYVGTGLTILGLASLAGATVETDPTSADFGQIKNGNTRYDIWGGFRPYANLIARGLLQREKSTTTGQKYKYGEGFKAKTYLDALYKFQEGKASPVLSFLEDAARGKDFSGDKFDLTNTNPLHNPITKRFLPLIAQDLEDTANEYGSLGPIVSIPGLFGIGTGTYKKKASFKSSGGIGTKIRRLNR